MEIVGIQSVGSLFRDKTVSWIFSVISEHVELDVREKDYQV